VLRSDTLPGHLSFGSTLQTLTFDRRGTPAGTLVITMISSTSGAACVISVNTGTGRASYVAY
jgi:hypothetical protein